MSKSAKSPRNNRQGASGSVAGTGEALKKIVKKAGGALAQAEDAVVSAVSGMRPAEAADGPKKQYLKGKPTVKVTFRLPREAASGAEQVALVGDFNGWDSDANPMRRLRDGSFTAVVELERGREYRFRYLIEGSRWENDWHADRYAPNAFGSDDSVVAL